MPRPKPPRINAADNGWPSSSTSAIMIAGAASAKARNRRSMLTAAPAPGAAMVAVDMKVLDMTGSGAEPKLLFQIVPLGARGINRAARIAGPRHHRAGVELGILAAEQFVQHEPVGRRPMAGVAIAHHRARRHLRRDLGKFRPRLQSVGLRVVEIGAVEMERAGDVTIGRRGRRLFLAEKERRRTGIDQSGAAGGFD